MAEGGIKAIASQSKLRGDRRFNSIESFTQNRKAQYTIYTYTN